MAKLETIKKEYGVPVSGRIDTEMAAEIADRAERLGVSMAKMVSILLAKGFHPKQPAVIDNRKELTQIHKEYKDRIATFINQVSNEDEQRERELIELFNGISTSDAE